MPRSVSIAPRLTLLCALLPFAVQAAPAPAPDLDTVVEATRDSFDVPGIAVAIIKDGEVVLARGWGEREAGTGDAVDSGTRFAIASLTKAGFRIRSWVW